MFELVCKIGTLLQLKQKQMLYRTRCETPKLITLLTLINKINILQQVPSSQQYP